MAKKPSKYCDSEDDDGTTAAEACPMTCGNCGCQDSLTWLYKGKNGKDCGESWRSQHTPTMGHDDNDHPRSPSHLPTTHQTGSPKSPTSTARSPSTRTRTDGRRRRPAASRARRAMSTTTTTKRWFNRWFVEPTNRLATLWSPQPMTQPPGVSSRPAGVELGRGASPGRARAARHRHHSRP